MHAINNLFMRSVHFFYEHFILYLIALALNATFSVMLMEFTHDIPTSKGAIGYLFTNPEYIITSILLSSSIGLVWIILSFLPLAIAYDGTDKLAKLVRIFLVAIGVALTITGFMFICRAISFFGLLIIGGLMVFFALKAISED
ncbi:hypothetical protein MCCC1A01412_16210 [Bacillus anthracis]|uniref:hypothetical protein n=1 Tax=Bacillus anthracis TaxID=1392 RepID=UPI0008FDBA62|nr:hypothetical protein [Bacillus anthracis]AXO94442.1 hypothetical protein DY471_19400 [Bacillus anthracis]OJD89222.1 hypothetical protein MCCC1A01412_16210 [Bacillus anthracis]